MLIYKLEKSNFERLIPMIKSKNELSVFTVLKGIMPGEVFVNDIKSPTSALIRTCECNLLAGNPNNAEFNTEVSTELDFWDQLTPDSEDWIQAIPYAHKNIFIRQHIRKHYVLQRNNRQQQAPLIPDGYTIRAVNLNDLREKQYKNYEKILEWASDWGSDEAFSVYGFGNYILDENNNEIVSWSLSDCFYEDKVTIGVHVAEGHRKIGFGKAVVYATMNTAFDKGYESIHWICVDFNKGSIAIAEKLGFEFSNEYSCFTSFPPCENLLDLSEAQWYDWGCYYENVTKEEPKLLIEQLYAFVKANNIQKTIETIQSILNKGEDQNEHFKNLSNNIKYFQTMGLCSNFGKIEWLAFLER